MVKAKAGRKRAKRNKVATVMTPVDKLHGKESMAHYNAVLMEEIRSQMRLVIEGVEASERRLLGKIDGVEKGLGQEIELLKNVIQEHSFQLKGLAKAHESLGLQTTGMSRKLDALDVKLTDKIDSIHTRFDDHEVRITAIEKAS